MEIFLFFCFCLILRDYRDLFFFSLPVVQINLYLPWFYPELQRARRTTPMDVHTSTEF